MSKEGLEVVEAAWEARGRGGLEAFAEYWADDIEWQAIGGRWCGKHAGRAYLQEWIDLFDEFKPEPVEVIDADGEQVITLVRYGGREKRSGVEVPREYFAVFNKVRDGKIVSGHEYASREEAVKAAGRREWAQLAPLLLDKSNKSAGLPLVAHCDNRSAGVASRFGCSGTQSRS
jgi:ketosteroid isomerase-like protein